MKAVVHVIATVAVLDVHVVGVSPAEWPGINEGEPVAAIVKAPIIVVAPADMKTVPVAKAGFVALVGNAAMLVATFDASGRLCLLRARLAPSGIALRRVSDRMRLLLPLGRAACCCGCWAGLACCVCCCRGAGLACRCCCGAGLACCWAGLASCGCPLCA